MEFMIHIKWARDFMIAYHHCLFLGRTNRSFKFHSFEIITQQFSWHIWMRQDEEKKIHSNNQVNYEKTVSHKKSSIDVCIQQRCMVRKNVHMDNRIWERIYTDMRWMTFCLPSFLCESIYCTKKKYVHCMYRGRLSIQIDGNFLYTTAKQKAQTHTWIRMQREWIGTMNGYCICGLD